MKHLPSLALLAATLALPTVGLAAPKIETSPKYQALLHAIIQTDVPGARRLLDEGLDPNARVHPAPGDNLTPDADKPEDQPLLTVAAIYGVPESPFVAMLLERKAEVDILDSRGRTPLMYAAQLGWGSSIERLIAHKADVNAADAEGVTVLMHAMGNRNRGVVADLINKGAKINARDGQGRTPLMHAIFASRYDPLQLISILPEKEPADEATPRYLALVRYLLDHGADVTARDKDGDTAADYARSERLPELSALLSKKGTRRR